MLRKSSIIAVVLLVILYANTSHAIDAQYRKQLERSGCSELTDGNGCDIHKTKAQNSVDMTSGGENEIKDFIKYSVMNQKTDAAHEALEGYGWQNNKPAIWVKGKYSLFLSIRDDVVVNAQLR